MQRFLFEGLDIRGVRVRLTGAWQSMLRGRGYGPVVARLLLHRAPRARFIARPNQAASRPPQ